jgi:hypothetical protein
MRGSTVYWENFLRVMAPMPEVAPTKTATRWEGRVEEMRVLEARIVVRDTIIDSCMGICGPTVLLLRGKHRLLYLHGLASWCSRRLVMRGDQLH